jgi:hypothetical protein
MTSNDLPQYCVFFQSGLAMAAKKSKKRMKAEVAVPTKEDMGQRDKSVTEEDAMYGAKRGFGGLPDRDLKKNLGGCG